MVSKKSGSTKESIQRYAEIRPQYERFCHKVQALLIDLLADSKIRYQVVEGRAKTTDSFAEKIEREGKSYDNPLLDITDLAGIRIILYYIDDVDRVCELIDREFVIDQAHSFDKRDLLAPDQFGYLSVHKVVTISDSRTQLPEWAPLARFKAEIQVRTVLQHAWAAISHALQYKRETDVPEVSRRKLTRLSGLFELADEEFAQLREDQNNLQITITRRVAEGNLDIQINALSIEQFVNQSLIVKEAWRLARTLGFRNSEPDLGMGISQLVQACNLTNIETVKDLDKALSKYQPLMRSFLVKFFEIRKAEKPLGSISGSDAHVAAMLIVGLSSTELLPEDITKGLGWGLEYADRVVRAGKVNKLSTKATR